MNKIIYLVTAVLTVVVFTQYQHAQRLEHQAKHNYVYLICNDARQEVSGDSEYNCGAVQERTHTEFMCLQRSSAPNNHCWVEDK